MTRSGEGTAVASSAVLATVGIGVQGVAKLLVTVVVGRVFGTETLGHTTALLSLSVFAALLWPNAAGNTASRYLAVALRAGRSDAAVNRLLGAATAVSSVVLAALTVPIAIAWGNGPSTVVGGVAVVVAYGLYCTRAGCAARVRSCAADRAVGHRDERARARAARGRVRRPLEPLVLLPLAVGYTVFAVACWPRGNRTAGPPEPTTGVLGFALWNVLAVTTANGLLQLTMIAAQVSVSAREAGVYAAAFTLATPASMLGRPWGRCSSRPSRTGPTAGPCATRGAALLVGASRAGPRSCSDSSHCSPGGSCRSSTRPRARRPWRTCGT